MESTDLETGKDLCEIQKFFVNNSVFVTGGTGFLGNILLEKLLRSCPGIKKIYVLMREKKGKDPNDRFKAIFDDVLFERMKKVCPDYHSKVIAVIGDCNKPNLGLSEQDRNTLINEVNTVFHVAATVRFDAHLRSAVNINIRATIDLLDLAHSMKNLKAFVHVSTAYSNCAERKVVDEKFYNPPVAPEALIKLTDSLSDNIIERITPQLIQPWPNTYAFTKAVAEDAVRTKGKGLPLSVVRPAIIIPTATEPIPGWINNYYGPTGVVAGAGIGLIRSIHANGDMKAEIVPADGVVNAIIAAAWDINKNWEKPEIPVITETKQRSAKDCNEIPIYNYVVSNSKPLRWKEFMAYNELAEPEIPSVLAVWIYGLTINKHKSVHQLYCIFLHLLPALIVDTFAKVIGKEPKLWDAYQKIHKFSEVISYFSTKQWTFVDSNLKDLGNRLSDRDKEVFDFDLTKLDWKQYFYDHIRGIRQYLVHDNLDTVPQGLEKRRRLMIAHYTLVTLFWCFLMYLAFLMCGWIFK